MNERLLNKQEICKMVCDGKCLEPQSECNEYAIVEMASIAQDAKSISARDKWWIEQIKKCPYQQFDAKGLATDNDSLATQKVYFIGSDFWQSLEVKE
jgi:hypothetical protein